jgi:ferredoxin-like protein FixX
MRNRLMMFFAAAMIAAAGATPAQSGDATFKLTNNARFTIMVKVFSQSRNWEWPSTTKHWPLDDSAQHSLRISCQDGEKVCYGGAFSSDDKTHWGVGFKGNKSCGNCCLTCGSNVSHAWKLNDAPPRTATGVIDHGTNLVPID